MPVDKGKTTKALAAARSRYTKKLLCTNLNVRLATVHKQGAKEDVLIKNQENNTFSLAQGKYPWGIIKNRKLNSKFVKCSKGGVPKQNALYFYDCKEMWVNFNRVVELYQKIW